MYAIEPQGKHEELCKQLTKFASTDREGNICFPPIRFPCLKVLLTDGTGDGKFSVTWSHFHHEHKLGPNKGQPITSEHPGKFKLKRVELRRPMLYEKSNGRTMTDGRGRKVFDFVEMAKLWGTEAVYEKGQHTWSYGPNHPMIEDTIWEDEYETIDSLRAALAARFGDDLAEDVCMEFFKHELYQVYDTTCVAV